MRTAGGTPELLLLPLGWRTHCMGAQPQAASGNYNQPCFPNKGLNPTPPGQTACAFARTRITGARHRRLRFAGYRTSLEITGRSAQSALYYQMG